MHYGMPRVTLLFKNLFLFSYTQLVLNRGFLLFLRRLATTMDFKANTEEMEEA
jgi:hypothetical protein